MVKLITTSEQQFFKYIKDKKLYCFGAGKIAEKFWHSEVACENINNIVAFIDNNPSKIGQIIELNGYKIPIIGFEDFLIKKNQDVSIIITSISFFDIIRQLDQESTLNNQDCFISEFLTEEALQENEIIFPTNELYKIPAKIHYCWFGKGPIPDQYLKYIDTWKKYCPEYEIVKWDEHNYDITKNKYMHEAYNYKKWGFVPDYARLDIIYNEGGIYLDTDVELIRNLDQLRYNEMYCGFEDKKYINFGLGFGAVKQNQIIKKLRDFYNDKEFIREDGLLNMLPSPNYQSEALRQMGFVMDGSYQSKDGISIYPKEFFAPVSFSNNIKTITKNSYSIHHYAATWWSEEMLKQRDEKKQKLNSLMNRMQVI